MGKHGTSFASAVPARWFAGVRPPAGGLPHRPGGCAPEAGVVRQVLVPIRGDCSANVCTVSAPGARRRSALVRGASDWPEVLSDPGGEFRFFSLPCREFEHLQHALCIRGVQGMPVEPEKQRHGHEGRALVAVDKRRVARKPKTIGGRKVGHTGPAVGGQVLRPRQRRLEEPLIAGAGRTAVLGQLLLVQCPPLTLQLAPPCRWWCRTPSRPPG